MTRVIAGLARGRRLTVPPTATRPTSDRAREALFSTLVSLRGPLDGSRFLDLYAGSGAVGLEALSRGAALVQLVEHDAAAVAVIGRNIGALGIPGAAVTRDRVERFVAAGSGGSAYDVCFLDPPYTEPAAGVAAVVHRLAAPPDEWLTEAAVVVVERSSHDPEWVWPDGFEALAHRRYGEATLWYGRRS